MQHNWKDLAQVLDWRLLLHASQTTAVRNFSLWWHSKGKHISHFIAETSIAETAAPICPIPNATAVNCAVQKVLNVFLDQSSYCNLFCLLATCTEDTASQIRFSHQIFLVVLRSNEAGVNKSFIPTQLTSVLTYCMFVKVLSTPSASLFPKKSTMNIVNVLNFMRH